MFKRKPKALTPEELEVVHTKDFFDMILPGTVKFLSDHYIVGDSYRCVWVIREYPPSTEEQAILSQLADRNGVTIRIYHRLVEAMEQRKIIPVSYTHLDVYKRQEMGGAEKRNLLKQKYI